MHILEDILASRVNIVLLRYLTAIRGGLSGNEIASRLGLRQSSARLALERLVKTGIITRVDIGRTAAYELDHELGFVNSVIVPLFKTEARVRRTVIDALAKACRRLSPKPVAVILFGSLAKGGREFRDADLLCIARNSDDRLLLHDAVTSVFETLKRRHGLPVTAVIVTESQLQSSKLASLKNEAKRDGILLYGTPPSALKGIRIWNPSTSDVP